MPPASSASEESGNMVWKIDVDYLSVCDRHPFSSFLTPMVTFCHIWNGSDWKAGRGLKRKTKDFWFEKRLEWLQAEHCRHLFWQLKRHLVIMQVLLEGWSKLGYGVAESVSVPSFFHLHSWSTDCYDFRGVASRLQKKQKGKKSRFTYGDLTPSLWRCHGLGLSPDEGCSSFFLLFKKCLLFWVYSCMQTACNTGHGHITPLTLVGVVALG